MRGPLLLALLAGAVAVSAGMSPQDLNRLRFPADFAATSVSGIFAVTLRTIGADDSLGTPADVKGPFHLPPEVVPDAFPARSQACVLSPTCAGAGGACATVAAANHSWAGSGLPLLLNVTVYSVSEQGVAPTLLPGASVDVWQAAPAGQYWKVRNGRQGYGQKGDRNGWSA